jgi:alcohol dehydrogenase
MKVNCSKLDLVPGKISPEDVDFIYERSLSLL